MKYDFSLWLILILALALSLAGCEKHDDSDGGEPVDGDDDTADDDDDDTAPADDDDDTPGPVTEEFTVDLTFEMRGAAHVKTSVTDDDLFAVFTIYDDYDIIAAGTQLSGDGKVYRFDGGLGMYAFKLQGPAVPDGPCGNDPISYSVTLMAKQENIYLGGGFTAYCGEDTYFGRPAKVYRISGDKKPEQTK